MVTKGSQISRAMVREGPGDLGFNRLLKSRVRLRRVEEHRSPRLKPSQLWIAIPDVEGRCGGLRGKRLTSR